MTAQPPTARGRARRLDVLDAARRVFSRTSYFDVRVADIAADAGVSHGTFYTYFASKDVVLRALVDEMVDDLFAAATTPHGSTADGDPLTDTLRSFMAAYRDRAPLLRVLEQVVTVNPEFLAVRLAIKERFTARIEHGLAAAQARGDADPALDPRHAAFALGGMVESMAFACYVLRQPELDEEVLVRTMARLWRGGIA